MHKEIRPIFIFSLPRSGSTLLQRTLASHPMVSTTAETWFLLPLIYMSKDNGVKTEYGYSKFRKGFNDFRNQIDADNKASYQRLLRQFVLNNYKLASNNNAIYFLDKTPRYSLICDQIIEMFPHGKFIFLWRNPLAVISSMIESWGKGRWNVYKYYIDLFDGLNNLINTCSDNEHQIFQIKYEDLVSNPEIHIKEILQYLNLEYTSNLLSEFNDIDFTGRMGDQTGTDKYSEISVDSIEKWRRTYNTHVRKKWAYKYLDNIGEKNLNKIGYSISELKNGLNVCPNHFFRLPSDIIRIGYGITKQKIKSIILNNA
ncbi:sulfotransferase [Fodinibius sp. Rm-B-1B1-1]|uniref:sulfotransferase family protein n=1 Tax=Fodinibius alkaliphilus TaxID=3140241 RepID=UPI00315A1101